MTSPTERAKNRGEQHTKPPPVPPLASAPLDPVGQVDPSWTVDNDRRLPPSAPKVVTPPEEPPDLRPGAANALLALLKHVNDKRRNIQEQE